MAQIKRKKVKAAKGQKIVKNSIFKNKLFWIIGSIVLVVLIASSIVGGILIYKHNHVEEEDKIDYFDNEYDGIKFNKNTYEGILTYLVEDTNGEGVYKENIFFCAYNSENFYPDPAIDEGKSKDNADDVFLYKEADKNAIDGLVIIQKKINEYNATVENESEKVYLYIIDTKFGNNANIFSNSTFGTAEETDFYFGYINGVNGFIKEFKNKDNDEVKELTTTSISIFRTTIVDRVLTFIGQDLDINN